LRTEGGVKKERAKKRSWRVPKKVRKLVIEQRNGPAGEGKKDKRIISTLGEGGGKRGPPQGGKKESHTNEGGEKRGKALSYGGERGKEQLSICKREQGYVTCQEEIT